MNNCIQLIIHLRKWTCKCHLQHVVPQCYVIFWSGKLLDRKRVSTSIYPWRIEADMPITRLLSQTFSVTQSRPCGPESIKVRAPSHKSRKCSTKHQRSSDAVTACWARAVLIAFWMLLFISIANMHIIWPGLYNFPNLIALPFIMCSIGDFSVAKMKLNAKLI